MVQVGEAGCIVKDTSIVVIKSLISRDSASNRSTIVNLVHHVFLTGDRAILLHIVLVVGGRDEASLTRVAVPAPGHGRAPHAIIIPPCLVNSTSIIGDVVVFDPLVGINGVATVATVVFLLTGDDQLRGKVDIGPGGIACVFDPIRQG